MCAQEAIDTSLRVNAVEATDMIRSCFATKLVPMLSGSPGLGKSAIYAQLASKYKLVLIDCRLSQFDPTDLSGFPVVGGRRATYLPMDTFPLDDDKVPAGMNGWLILLDEINSASMAVQAAAYKLVLDRMVGSRHLHPKAHIGCAGNLSTDGAIVNRMGTAMQSRLIHLELGVDFMVWIDWASSYGVSDKVISYVKHAPADLHNFKPDHNDKTFACPRTWEYTSRHIKFKPNVRIEEKRPLIAGTIGQGVASDFITYCEVYSHIPTYKDILQDPRGIRVTEEPSMLCALSGMIGSTVSKADLPKVMPYIHRLPIQFQVFALRDACRRNARDKFHLQADIADWIQVNGDLLV
jgi:hypothetical protein